MPTRASLFVYENSAVKFPTRSFDPIPGTVRGLKLIISLVVPDFLLLSNKMECTGLEVIICPSEGSAL